MTGFLAVLGWKMVVYSALLAVVCWAWRQATVERDEAIAKARGEALLRANAEADADELRRAVDAWRYAANAATTQATEAQREAALIRQKFDQLTAEILATPVPEDAVGALGWLAEVAKGLTAQVRL